MSRLLALDSSTDACSATLITEGQVLSRHEIVPRKHTQRLPEMIGELFDESGESMDRLDAVAFGCGPGSFAGLRIACGLAQGIALATDCAIYPISTLAAMALQPLPGNAATGLTVATLDARLGEIYLGVYRRSESDDGLLICLIDDLVSAPEEIDDNLLSVCDDREFVVVGNGWSAVPAIEAKLGMPTARFDDLRPRALEIAQLAMIRLQRGETGPLDAALPVYLRDNVATRPASAK